MTLPITGVLLPQQQAFLTCLRGRPVCFAEYAFFLFFNAIFSQRKTQSVRERTTYDARCSYFEGSLFYLSLIYTKNKGKR